MLLCTDMWYLIFSIHSSAFAISSSSPISFITLPRATMRNFGKSDFTISKWLLPGPKNAMGSMSSSIICFSVNVLIVY